MCNTRKFIFSMISYSSLSQSQAILCIVNVLDMILRLQNVHLWFGNEVPFWFAAPSICFISPHHLCITRTLDVVSDNHSVILYTRQTACRAVSSREPMSLTSHSRQNDKGFAFESIIVLNKKVPHSNRCSSRSCTKCIDLFYFERIMILSWQKTVKWY